MDFLKAHYEKLILGVVLLGLAVAAWFVSAAPKGEDEFGQSPGAVVFESKATPLDTSTYDVALARFNALTNLDLENQHHLFNPNVWQRKPDGSFVTGTKLGPKGLVIDSITPLLFTVTFVDVSEGISPRCSLRIQRVNAPGEKGMPTAMTSTLMAVGEKNKYFKFLEARPPESPTAVVLEMEEDGQTVTLEKGKSYERVEGYMAELQYSAENKNFRNVREKTPLVLSGETNNVVSVTANEIILLNPSTTLKTTLKYNAAP